MPIKLLVYIPTYNRAESLLKQLKVLSSYRGGNVLEVVVSDNASTQPEYATSIPKFCEDAKFKYIRRISNVGPNPNIMDGFTHSGQADHIWILADDDILKPDAINKVFDLLERHIDADLLFFTIERTKESFEQYDQKKLVSSVATDGYGLISLVVWRTEFIKPYLRAGWESMLFCFQHVAVLYEATKKMNKFSVCRVSNEEIFAGLFFDEHTEDNRDQSFFGFTVLAQNLDPALAKKFLWDWWKVNSVKAIRNADLAPIHSAACFAMMKKYIPVRFFLSKFLPRNLFTILHLPLHKLDRKQIKLFQFKGTK